MYAQVIFELLALVDASPVIKILHFVYVHLIVTAVCLFHLLIGYVTAMCSVCFNVLAINF